MSAYCERTVSNGRLCCANSKRSPYFEWHTNWNRVSFLCEFADKLVRPRLAVIKLDVYNLFPENISCNLFSFCFASDRFFRE